MRAAEHGLSFESELKLESSTGVCEIRGSQQQLTIAFTDFETLMRVLKTALPSPRRKASPSSGIQQALQSLGVQPRDLADLAQTILVIVADQPFMRIDNSTNARSGWLTSRLGLPPVQFERATLIQRWRLLRLYLQSR